MWEKCLETSWKLNAPGLRHHQWILRRRQLQQKIEGWDEQPTECQEAGSSGWEASQRKTGEPWAEFQFGMMARKLVIDHSSPWQHLGKLQRIAPSN
jgi:hypothetical protein